MKCSCVPDPRQVIRIRNGHRPGWSGPLGKFIKQCISQELAEPTLKSDVYSAKCGEREGRIRTEGGRGGPGRAEALKWELHHKGGSDFKTITPPVKSRLRIKRSFILILRGAELKLDLPLKCGSSTLR